MVIVLVLNWLFLFIGFGFIVVFLLVDIFVVGVIFLVFSIKEWLFFIDCIVIFVVKLNLVLVLFFLGIVFKCIFLLRILIFVRMISMKSKIDFLIV